MKLMTTVFVIGMVSMTVAAILTPDNPRAFLVICGGAIVVVGVTGVINKLLP